MKRFEGKVVLVTGAGSGIGKATAMLFAREGARVIVVDRNEANGRETIEALQDIGADALFIKTDVSIEEEVKKSVEFVMDIYQRIDVLINNAGIELSCSLIDTTQEEWDSVLGVNLKGIFLMCKHVLPHMVNAEGGAVVNTSSISGLLGWPDSTAYCASKSGVIGLTKQLAVDYAEHHIRLNCVCPGTTITPMIDRLFSLEKEREKAERNIAEMHLLRRFAQPEEIAEAILFLASDEASFITGAILPVDGGYTAK